MPSHAAPLRPLRLCVMLIMGAMAVIPHTPLSARQNPASVRPTWADMETWTRLHEESRENEVGLGLNLVAAIVKLHGFRLAIFPGPGCRVEIACPDQATA